VAAPASGEDGRVGRGTARRASPRRNGPERKRRSLLHKTEQAWWVFLGACACIAIWAYLAGGQQEYMLPGPDKTARALGSILSTSDFWSALGQTIGRALTGLAIAIVGGVAWGSAIGKSLHLDWLCRSLLQILLSTPAVIFVIIGIVWFEGNSAVVVFVVAIVTTPLLTTATASAVRAIDTDRYFVVAANILGGCQGSTGPSSIAPDGRPWGSRFPWLTTRDAVAAETRLADALGIDAFHLVVGASLGGHRAIEWAVSHPQRVRNLVLVATGASTTADQLAWCHLQELAIVADPFFFDGDYYSHAVGPVRGLGLARALAHTTYRSAAELDTRFGRAHQGEEDPAVGGRYQIESYLDYHAGKLLARFDANTYLIVTHSMMVHDVGTGRGGIQAALSTVTARTLVVDVDSDRLFQPAQAEELADGIPGAHRETVHSLHGHDGFLIETGQMEAVLRRFLAESEAEA